jgi:diguanylate cyclase (GGDEF)-like protein
VRHEDFTSLEVEKVIDIVLKECLAKSGADAVHWMSSVGLSRVNEISEENWTWAFTSADVVGKHVISMPPAELFDLFRVWKGIATQYIQKPHGSKLKPIQSAAAPNVNAKSPSPHVAFPLIYNGDLLGVLAFEGVKTIALREELDVAAKYVAFAYQHYEAKNMSYLDELTGLYNQRYLPRVLDHEIERGRRESNPFSLLFLDIDFFKMVNDGRGHVVGSKLLIELGQVLTKQIRSCDYAFRYGGDEFIILLGGSNAANSEKVAERIRKAVEAHSFEIDGHKFNLTISIGLSSFPEHSQTAQGLIQLADQAMYYGKRKSRNIVFVAS